MNKEQVDTAAIGLLWPERLGTPEPHARVRRLTTTAWLTASGIQFVVWALIVMISFDWQAPWWLWTFVPGAIVTAGVHWITELDIQSRRKGASDTADAFDVFAE